MIEGKSVNYMTGNTFHDAAGTVFGYGNGSLAATNDTLIAAMRFVLGMTSNPEQLYTAALEWYPGLNTDDRLTRELTATEAATDWVFGSGSAWEATARAR